MGDHHHHHHLPTTTTTTLSNARKELEDLYCGIPDDSVNLTFQDLAEISSRPQKVAGGTPPAHNIMVSPRKEEVAPLTKLPSLDFNRAIELAAASSRSDHPVHMSHVNGLKHGMMKMDHNHNNNNYGSPFSHHEASRPGFRNGMMESSISMGLGYDEMSGMTSMGASMGIGMGGRRRPGIPHSNICTVCCTYIYIFRHRCLVCGRVYCRQCVGIGMGEMKEGRKCIECLGRRFSQRYIKKAGEIGCCMGYPSTIKQQELKWAEKGPRRSGENRYGRSGMVSQSRSAAPSTTRPPRHFHTPNNNNNNSNSFVMSSPYSPYYSATNHPLPF